MGEGGESTILKLSDIPRDSILHNWSTYLSITEIPFSYQVAGGLSTIGALLRRNRWVDQYEWRVFPNQSVLFIGPSGVGKDTIINRCQRTIDALEWISRVPTIGGATIENIYTRMEMLSKPAAAYIPAAEMTAFFGKADYQANMMTGMTNLLSSGSKVDITTKGQLLMRKGDPVYIYEPTLTMHAGSTVEWLHQGMPQGTLEGGFLGRFLIVIEELGGRFVSLVKRDKSKAELAEITHQMHIWNDGVEKAVRACGKPCEMLIFTEAEEMYDNWYRNRFKYFSKAVLPYANRSRDMVLRIAMLMAISRGHYKWVEEQDMAFAIGLMADIAQKIDQVVLPPSDEAKVAQKILELLPTSRSEIYRVLALRYKMQVIDQAINMLVGAKRMCVDAGKNVFMKVEEGGGD